MVWIGILISALLCWTMLIYLRDSKRPMVEPEATPAITNGYTIMLCHKRGRGVGRSRVRGEWSRGRAELVRSLREEIGFTSYVQVHQVSRWSLTYNLVVASRSWPLVAIISILHGLPVPRPRLFHRETREERWDVIEQFAFFDHASALAFLAAEGAANARTSLAADTKGIMRRSHAIFLRSSEAYAEAGMKPPGCYTLFALRSRPYLGTEEAMRYWLKHHRPFVVKQQPVLGYCAYWQHVAERSTEIDSAIHEMSAAEGEPWDAVASLQHRTFADLASGIVNPRVLLANTRLVNDEVRFLETERSSLLIGKPLAAIL